MRIPVISRISPMAIMYDLAHVSKIYYRKKDRKFGIIGQWVKPII